jgi:hypothetical protein
MKYIAYFLIIFSSAETLAQQVTVRDSRKATYLNGQRIKKGHEISTTESVRIAGGGHLGLTYGRLTFYLDPGTYDLDSVLQRQKMKREYIIDDSIYSVLKKENLLNCKKTGIQCVNCNALANPNHKRQDHSVVATGDSVTLRWDQHPDYKDNYYVVFSTMFEEYIHIQKTAKNELNFNILPFKREKAILYKVISKDCIESDWMLIHLE